MTEEIKVSRPAGRPAGALNKLPTLQGKFKQVLKHLDPLLVKALKKAEQILDADLDSKNVTATTQLQAAKMVLDKSIELRQAVYGSEGSDKEEDEADVAKVEALPTQARFSTKVVVPIKGD